MLTQFLQNLNPGSGNASLHLLDSSPSATPGSGLSQPEDSSQEITTTPDPSTMLNNNDKPGLSEGAPSGPSTSVPGGKTKPQAAGLTHLRPVSALGTEYFVLTPPSSGNLKEFAVRAGPTGTRVDIQLKRPVTFQGTSYPAGQVLSVTLKPNQVALMQSDSDLSGSRVTASSPVAVFSGHNCAQEDSTACGRVVRQLLPTSAWGTDYLVASQNSQKPYDVAYVVAKQTTKLTYNHGGTTGFRWLKKGEVAEFEIRPSRPLHLTADKGIQVLQFGTGTSRDGATSDPELVLVPDVASYCSSYVVKSMPGSERVALVVAPTKAAEQLTLDTHSLRNQLTWTAVPGSEFSFAEVALGSEDKNHIIKAPANFGLLPFGIQQAVDHVAAASCGRRMTQEPTVNPEDPRGEEFLAVFMQNFYAGSTDANLYLLVTSMSNREASVSVLSHADDTSQKVTVRPRQTVKVNIGDKAEMVGSTTFRHAVVVHSDQRVSVQAVNFKPKTAELTHLWPVSALGTEYFVFTPPSAWVAPEFAVVAGATGARVSMKLKGAVTFKGKSYPAGQVLSVSLQPYEVAQVQSDSDLSGSKVTSSSPVAVFSGHTCAQKHTTCNHVVEQLLPTSAWGTHYVVATLDSQNVYDLAYVVASQPTKVTYNHGGTTGSRQLKEGQVAEFEVQPSRPLHLTADRGIQVLLLSTGALTDELAYDPYLVLVPDVASYCSSYVVKAVPDSAGVALVVAPTKAAEQLTLDTHSLRNQLTWTAVPGSEFSIAEVALGSEDTNHIAKAPVNFGLLTIGLDQAVGYGTSAACVQRSTQKDSMKPGSTGGEKMLTQFLQNLNPGSGNASLHLLDSSPSATPGSGLSQPEDSSQEITATPDPSTMLNNNDKPGLSEGAPSGPSTSVPGGKTKPQAAGLTHLRPVGALGTEYFVLTPPSSGNLKEFAVRAGPTGARVDIQLKRPVTFQGTSYPAGQVLSVTLKPNQVALIQSDSDLSGSRVTASSPVAVFSGHNCAQEDSTACGRVVRQLLPTSAWGTDYVVASQNSQKPYDVAYVVAKQTTKLTYNHGGTTGFRWLKKGEVAEFEIRPSRPLHLTADKGTQVLQFGTGTSRDGATSDPELVLVPDVASYCSSYVVKSMPGSERVALVVAPTKAAEQLTLDTHSLRNQLTWTAVPGSEFSFAEVALGSEDKNHNLKAPFNFGLLPFGIRQPVRYGTGASCGQKKPGSTGGEKMLTQFLQNLNPGSGNASLHLLDSSPSATPGSGLSQPEDSSQEITATPDPSTMLNNNDKPGLSEGAPSGPSTSVPGGKTKPQAAGLTHLRPVSALGTEYFVLTPPSSGNLKEFAVRAGPTGARVDIQLKRPVTFQGSSYPAGQVLSVTLKPNQVALMQSDSDLSGSRVTASSPVAVFSGHNCAQEDSTACGRVVRQLLPTSAWGTDYVVASQNSQKPYDVAYVVAKQTTKLTYNHGGTTGFRWLKKGEVAEFEIRPSRPLHLTADKGTQVLQFGTGTSRDGATSDPELVLVPDVASYCSSYVVKSMPGSERVALVVAPTKAAEQLTLDTHSLRNQLTWTAVPGSEFSFAEVALGSEDKNHNLKAPFNFGLLPFGIRQPVRYGTGASCGQKKPGSTGGEKMLTQFLQNLNPGSGNASLHLLDSSPSATPGSGLSQPEDSSQEITATPDPSTMLNNNDKPGLSEGAPSGPSTSVPGGKTKPQAAGLTHLRPVSALGTEYFVLTPPSSGNLKEFAVRAGPTGARVDIQLKRPVTFQGSSYPAGQVLSVTLKPNQVALMQSDSDLSGSRVTASSPVAVFSGHNCAQEDSTACGRVVRQLLPTSAWGTDYVVASQNSQKPYDVAYVVAKQTTKLTYNHGGTTGFRWLKKGEVAEFEIRPSRPLHLTADKGTQVLQFGTGTSRDGATSDPELVLVPDVASYCSSYVVKSMPGSERVALVVAPTKAAEQLTLDTHSLRNQLTWTAVPGSEFSFAEVALGSEDKNHNLKAPFNFGLLPFGIRQPVRYGTGASCGQKKPGSTGGEKMLTQFLQNLNPGSGNASLHLLDSSPSATPGSGLSQPEDSSQEITATPDPSTMLNNNDKPGLSEGAPSGPSTSVPGGKTKPQAAGLTHLRPVSALGTEYFVLTPPSSGNLKEFAVRAGPTGARVDIQLKRPVTFQGSSYPAGQVLSVTLKPNQVALMQSDSDLSGSRVTASSPVAVFSGHNCAQEDSTACGRVVRQLLPTSAWGTDYVVASQNSQKPYDVAYVVAKQTTKLTYNHGGTTGFRWLKKGEVAEFEIRPSRPLHLTADKGTQVLQFGTGTSRDGATSDPELVLVPDVASYCSSYVVKSMPGSERVALVVAPTKAAEQLTLDTHSLRNQLTWTAVPGSEFSFAEVALGSEDKNHNLKAPFNFGLLPFGIRQPVRYGTGASCGQRMPQEVTSDPDDNLREEFLTVFMQNFNPETSNTSLHLLVTSMSDKAASVSVLSHADNTSLKVTVRPGHTVKVNIGSKAEMVGSTTFRHAVVVHSDQRVSVQAVNAKKATADVTQLRPVSALGTEYFVFTPPRAWASPEFAVVAGATGARVDMQLKGAVTFQGKSYPAGDVLSVTLQPYEVAQVQSDSDLSGSKVTASSPVAVFSGYTCAKKHTNCDHVVEQLLPTSAWGTHYVVATLNSQNLYDLAYVVASQPTKLTYNHGGTTGSQQLKEGEVAEFEVRPSRPLHLTADKGIQVLLFGTGASKDGVTYDPYLVLVPDVASYCSSYVVKTVPGSKGVALMVAPTKTTKQFTLDDHTLGDQLTWTAVPGSEFSFAETDLGSEDTNHVAKAPANFGLLTFGMDQYIGYGTSTACDQRKTQEVSMTPRNTVTEEFLAAFMQNTNAGSNNTSLHLLVTSMSDKAATVSVLSHADHTSQKVTVRPRQTVKVNISSKAEMVGSTTFRHAVVVHSDQRVSVQAVNAKKATADVTQLWPVSALGTEYFVFTPPNDWVSPEFAVVAGATGARVDMQLKGAVTFQGQFYPAGQVLGVTLKPYEVVQVQSYFDLSGSKVTASSPVAVFSGHTCATKHTTCDHVVEQLLPTSAWGTHYVVATLNSQNLYDLAYVVASQPTKLTYNHGGTTGSQQLKEGEVAEFEVRPSRPLHLTADKGIQVLLFGTGASKDGVTYDPYLVLVPDVASYCSSYVVKTVPGSKGVALMVAPTKTTKQFTLDDHTLGDQLTWTTVPGSEFSFAETDLGSEDTNHVAKAPANFGLLTFGMDQYIGYGTSTACDQRKTQEVSMTPRNTVTEEFLAAFMQNIKPEFGNTNLHLLITSISDQAATVSVLSHADHTSQKVTVRPRQTVKVNIGDKAEMVGSTTFQHAVVVHSDQRVSVQAVNAKKATADVTQLWPVSALGTEYFVFTPPSAWVSPEFAVVAGATGARVSMKLKGAVTFQGKFYPAGQVLSVTLQPYEVAQVQSDSDLSGSKVTASSPVAVFSGHSCAQKHTTSCDHVVEQLLPTSAWGTHYVVATLDSQNLFDLAYVVASQPTKLTYNQGGITGSHQLEEGEVAEFEVQPSRPLHLTADKGIQVLLFGTGASKDGVTYDPYLVLVPDVASYCSSYVVKTVPGSKGVALMVAPTKTTKQFTLDDYTLGDQLTWTAVPGSEFSFAETDLSSEDTNHVAKAPANFGLLTFGMDQYIGYGTSTACDQRMSQEATTKTKNTMTEEFLTAFMQNFNPGSSNANLHLLVTSMSDQAATVSVLSHADNTSQKVTVRPGQTVKVNIGDKAEMVGSTTFRHAVVVHSDQRVSVQSVNFKPLTADLTHLWPVSALGTEYFVFTPPSAWVSPEFAVVAGATGARVSMKLKGAVTFQGKSYPAGQVLSVTLQPYEVAQVQSDSDLSGSKVTASSPVAVFSGHSCAQKHTTSCDHVVEQLLPTSAWGTHYVVATLDSQNLFDLAYVVAKQTTMLTYNHGGTTGSHQLKEGQVAEFEIQPSRPLYLTADKGIQVLQFGTGASKDRITYDPYLVLVPDVASYCSSYVVKTVPDSKGVALVVASTKDAEQLILDNHSLRNQLTWTAVPGSEFSFAEVALGSEDTNHVAKAPANFGLLPFGLDHFIGYGTSAACNQRKKQEVPMRLRNSRGKEFLAAFMQNFDPGSSNANLHLLVTSMSDQAATVSVLSHADNTSQKVTVRPGQTVKVNIGDKAEMVGSTTFRHAVVVHSDQRVSVQAVNFKPLTADLTHLWPVSALGTEYFVFTPPSAWVSPEFAVVAGATGARVSMKLKGAVTFKGKSYPAGQVLSVSLKPYEVAQVQSDSDLSGSKVTASSPVAVFSGHTCAIKHTTSCDHMVEQLLPTSAWGTHYVVTTLDTQNAYDLAYVVASQPTKVTYNHGGTTGSQQLKEGEVAEFEVRPSRPLHLTADKGIQVLLFGTGASKDGVAYDPYLVLVPDVASYCSSYVVKTVPGSKGVALVVASTKAAEQLILDNHSLRNQLTWTAVPGSEFSFAEVALGSEDTNHVIKGPANFGLLPFGLDQFIGYGTSAACDESE
ncbi:uncharacterized protein LOC132532997 [Erinaceus europaeus]|uniref:Uncharacterized protein LOC132532997 n=1 Tax=Erinaceus europaeus TaxID=9365 RepID=A0ABM3VVD3_ERIEU|nr:uncharacterized protein LOC132532997 [Erinaceus europaeus]